MKTIKLIAQVAALTALGYWDGSQPDRETPKWRTAVQQFQRGQLLKCDGIVGPKTSAKMCEALEPIAESPHPDFTRLRPWKMTRYWIADLKPGSVPMINPEGETIARVAPRSFIAAALEGSARLADGRLVEVASGYAPWSTDYDPVARTARGYIAKGRSRWAGIKMRDGAPVGARRFEIESGRGLGEGYGLGSSGRAIVPGLTVAADNGRMVRHDKRWRYKGGPCPAGTRVYIAELVGWDYGSGVSDGWVTVTDTGGGIVGAHFDLFVGSRRTGRRLPERVHVWWPGMDHRLPPGYDAI